MTAQNNFEGRQLATSTYIYVEQLAKRFIDKDVFFLLMTTV